MSEQPKQPPQPDSNYVLQALHEELDRANANRLYLIASLKQAQAEGQGEINRLGGVLMQSVSMIEDEDNRAKVFAFAEASVEGKPWPPADEQADAPSFD